MASFTPLGPPKQQSIIGPTGTMSGLGGATSGLSSGSTVPGTPAPGPGGPGAPVPSTSPTTTDTPGGLAPTPRGHINNPTQATPGAPQQGQGTGFINLQRVVNANASGAQNLASNIQGTETAMGDAAKAEGQNKNPADFNYASVGLVGDSAKDAQTAQDYANNANKLSGLQAIMQKQYKGQTYTSGQSSLDAMLAQQAGGPAFQQAQTAYGDLVSQVQPKKEEVVTTPPVSPGKLVNVSTNTEPTDAKDWAAQHPEDPLGYKNPNNIRDRIKNRGKRSGGKIEVGKP